MLAGDSSDYVKDDRVTMDGQILTVCVCVANPRPLRNLLFVI